MKHETLRAVRERKKWTQAETAFRAGVDKGTVSRIESGEVSNPSNDTVAKLEKALGLRRGALVFGELAKAS